MSVLTLLGYHWRRHRLPLIPMAAGAALFEWAITRVAPDVSQAGLVQNLLQLAPPAMLRIFSEELTANVSAAGFIAFGYVHPFLLILMAIWAIRVSAGTLAGQIGLGTMDLIAARPVARSAQVMAAALALLAGLVVLGAAAWAGTAIGVAGRPLPGVDANAYLRVVAGCWLLFAAIGALGLAISAARREGGSAIALTSAIVAPSFVLDYLGRAWDKMAPFRFLSVFRYYEPSRILREGLGGTDVVVLGSVTAAALLVAFVVFRRRDL